MTDSPNTAGQRCANCGHAFSDHRLPLTPMDGLVWCPGDGIRTFKAETAVTESKPHTAEPCRHCGGEPYRHEADEEIIGGVAIGCSRCGALGPFKDVDDFRNKDEAFAAAEIAWNARTPDPEAAAEIKALREAVEAGGTRILCLLGGERDAMPAHVVKAFQEIANDLTAALKDHRKAS